MKRTWYDALLTLASSQLRCLALMHMMCASQSWGTCQLVMGHLLQAVLCQEDLDISCEVIDLRTLLPWDAAAVGESVHKQGWHVAPSSAKAFHRECSFMSC